MKQMLRKSLIALATGAVCSMASAQITNDVVKIGVIVDQTGLYSAHGGPGVIRAVEMAVKDFGGTVNGKPIQVVSADYQNKVDIALAKGREWFDRDNVDMVIESTDSAAAIALQRLGKEKKRVTIAAGSASMALTNQECSPYGVHYVYDTYSLATGTGRAVVEEGGDTWYFITVDYAMGASLEKETTATVTSMGGKILGVSKHPMGTMDYSSYLLQAQASKAKVVALANAGKDTQIAVRQAAEFGITAAGQKLATMLVFVNDVKGMGLDIAQGLMFTTGFYWDRNDEARAWSKRFFDIQKTMPSMVQAGAYSATMHYLNAIKSAGTDDADAVMKKVKSLEINDFFAKNGKVREDGRMVYDMYLAQAKKPAESKGPWDLYNILRTIPGESVVQPLSKSTCSFVKQ